MANSLSVEETNVIRERLGMKLIPLDGVKVGKTKAVSSNTHSISIQETNKIRLQFSLKLIPTEQENVSNEDIERQNYIDLHVNTQNKANIDELKASLEEKKSQLKRRKQLAKGGVLDRDSGAQSLEDWLSEIGNAKDVPNLPNGDKLAPVDKPLKKRLKFKSASNVKDEDVKIFTLKDVDVMDDKVNDELVHNETELDKKFQNEIEAKKLQSGELVSEIARDNRLLGETEYPTKKRKLVSLKSLSSDEDVSDGELQSTHINRDTVKPKFKKPKRSKKNSRVRPVDSDIDFKPVKLINEDEDDGEGDNELDSILAANRVEKLKQRVIDEPKPKPVSENRPKGEVVQENLYFLDNIKAEPKDDKGVSSKPDAETIPQQEKDNIQPEISKRVQSIIRAQDEDQNYSISSILSKLESKKEGSKDDGEIKIKYTDDQGNELSTKEAYKFISRKFHGTGLNKKSKLS